PRVKGDLLQLELDDGYTSGKILQACRHNLHCDDYHETAEPFIAQLSEGRSHEATSWQPMLQRLQPQDSQLCDIDRYSLEDPNWLRDWWRVHRKPDRPPSVFVVQLGFTCNAQPERGHRYKINFI
ncbi:hypothetical protein V1508DRAFT_452444, partial [Lipomyces doorenjongii]|uniref:uncharacterized protein n=1 Tax=Lipomyces doorenjongii TaxID=383834 RepID=UPI0034CE0D45